MKHTARIREAASEPPGDEEIPKKPKTKRGQARAAAILAVARELFVHGGYAEMTMRQVSERLGMSLSNVQHYFPSRESLLEGLLNEVMSGYDPVYADVTGNAQDPGEQLAAIVRYLIADARKAETEKLFVEIWSLATRDDMVRKIFDRMYCHHRQTLEKYIQAANPALSARQVRLRSALVAMQIEGLMLLISEAKPRHKELAGIEEECVAAIFRIIEVPLPG